MDRRARRVSHHNLLELAEWNLAAKRLATKFIVVGCLAALFVPASAALFRGSGETNAWLVAGAPIVLVVVIVFGLRDFRRFARSDRSGVWHPPSYVGYIVAGQIAATLFALGTNEDLAFYRATMVVGIVMVALVGSAREIVSVWFANVLLLLVTAAAEHLDGGSTVRLVLGYGMLWAVASSVVYAVVSATFQALIETRTLTDAATVAANVEDLSAGLDAVLPLVASYAGASAVTVARIGPGGSTPIASWSADDGSTDDGSMAVMCPPALVDAATQFDGVAVDGRDAVMVVPDADATALAVHVWRPIAHRGSSDGDLYRAQLELMAVQLRGLVERSRFVEALNVQTRTDPLTQIANRRGLFERLEALAARNRATDDAIAIAMLDLDDFKRFNDRHGHLAGDELLAGFGAALRQRCRAGDLVARYGGEEFCVVLVGSDGDGAMRWLHDLRVAANDLGRPDRSVTFSAGITVWSPGESVDAVLGRADDALLDAKAAGKDRTHHRAPTSAATTS